MKPCQMLVHGTTRMRESAGDKPFFFTRRVKPHKRGFYSSPDFLSEAVCKETVPDRTKVKFINIILKITN